MFDVYLLKTNKFRIALVKNRNTVEKLNGRNNKAFYSGAKETLTKTL